jgi:hypothetical protein
MNDYEIAANELEFAIHAVEGVSVPDPDMEDDVEQAVELLRGVIAKCQERA